MANLFGKNQGVTPTTERGQLEAKYNNYTSNILWVIAFTVINLILLAMDGNSYFLFSAFIPYFVVDMAMLFTGSYPAEFYEGLDGFTPMDNSVLIITVAIAALVLVLYLICWLFAHKQKVGWLIFATVLFSIDTAALLLINGLAIDFLIDIIFHVWVIICLALGIATHSKLKKLPEDEPENLQTETTEEEPTQNSPVLRMADMQEKSRILLEASAPGYHIVYRRVKRTNELIVNGRVYDEYEALVELPHTLTATIDGHTVEMEYDASSRMYIFFDGEELAKKLRLV